MNIFKQLIVSLYSPKDISAFRQQGIGKTILYVFLLTLISLLPTLYFFSTTTINGVNILRDTIQNDLPAFTIENGELLSDKTAPVTINKNDLTILFDSTGTVNQEDARRTTNSIFFLKNELTYTIGGQSQSMPYSMFNNMTITKDDLLELTSSMDSFLPILLPIISVVIYLFSTISKFIGVSFLALIGLALKNMLGKEIKYGRLWRLSAYSVTLPTIFFMIMDSLQTIVPSGFFIYWFVSIIILILVLKEIPSSKMISESN